MSDVAPSDLKEDTVSFIKKLLGRDMLTTDVKHEASINFVSYATLVIISNFSSTELKMFEIEAINQRLMSVPIPTVLPEYRLNFVASVLLENKEGIANWASSIDPEFVASNLRADAINRFIVP